MTEVKNGDTVRLHYTGRLPDGTQFGTSEGRAPIEFTVGAGQVITGLETEVDGMAVSGVGMTAKRVPTPPMAIVTRTRSSRSRATRFPG